MVGISGADVDAFAEIAFAFGAIAVLSEELWVISELMLVIEMLLQLAAVGHRIVLSKKNVQSISVEKNLS